MLIFSKSQQMQEQLIGYWIEFDWVRIGLQYLPFFWTGGMSFTGN